MTFCEEIGWFISAEGRQLFSDHASVQSRKAAAVRRKCNSAYSGVLADASSCVRPDDHGAMCTAEGTPVTGRARTASTYAEVAAWDVDVGLCIVEAHHAVQVVG